MLEAHNNFAREGTTMAFYRTAVARTGFVDEMVERLAANAASVSAGGHWIGPVADDESGAIDAANDKFLSDSFSTGGVLADGSTEAWEITGKDDSTVIGWSMTADGWFEEYQD